MTTQALAVLGLLALLGLGCQAPRQRYHWGDYEASLHQLAKDPSSADAYGAALLAQISKGEPTRSVPPGIYAEYGYYLLEKRQHSDSVLYFQKEKATWPESSAFMDRMIKLASAPQKETPR